MPRAHSSAFQTLRDPLIAALPSVAFRDIDCFRMFEPISCLVTDLVIIGIILLNDE